MAPGEDISDRAGESAEIDLCGFPIFAVVANSGAPIRARGFEVVFVVCSRECVAAIRLAATLDAVSQGLAMPDPDAEGVFGLRRTRSAEGMSDRILERLELFETTVRKVAPSIARRLGIDKLPSRHGPDASPEERELIESRLGQSCAWCLRQIPANKPVEGIHVWLKEGHDGTPDRGIVLLKIAGRNVPARLPEPGSLAYGSCDAAFMVCSKACAAALTAAITDDQRLSVVH